MTTFIHSLAVLIGVDAYGGGIPRLTTSVNDATLLAHTEIAAAGNCHLQFHLITGIVQEWKP